MQTYLSDKNFGVAQFSNLKQQLIGGDDVADFFLASKAQKCSETR
jgi:hypothetical protein